MPQDSVLALQANADWARFNGILAGATATLAYYHLLPLRAIMMEPFCRGVPPFDAAFTRIAYPALAALLRLLLQISPAGAVEALDQIRRLFEETDRRIADGRPFLAGDTLSLGDFALASAAAPVLLPPGFMAPCPPFADFPPALQAVVVEMRQHPTGQFVTRFFAK
jgi:glutathione S-transferase